MEYRLILTQDGGCDYTIGCGVRIVKLEAQTLSEAKAEAKARMICDYGSVRGVPSAEIVAIEKASWLFRPSS